MIATGYLDLLIYHRKEHSVWVFPRQNHLYRTKKFLIIQPISKFQDLAPLSEYFLFPGHGAWRIAHELTYIRVMLVRVPLL